MPNNELAIFEMLFSIDKRLEKLEKLIRLMGQKEKKNWVPVSVINELTGWNNEKMRSARENGYIQYKILTEKKDGKEVRHFKYLLESIPDVFIKYNNNLPRTK